MATLLNQILQFIGNHICVESGTSGIWTYKKFGDGTAECWGDYITPMASTDSLGNGIYKSPQNPAVINLPTGLFVSNPIIASNIIYPACYQGGDVTIYNSNTLRGWLFTIGSVSQLVEAHFQIHAYGKWK